MKNNTKLALIQCICPHYRVPFFKKLAEQVDLTLFYGKGERKGSWQNAENITGFKHRRLFSITLKFQVGNYPIRLVWFPTLLFHIYREKPDIIISEGFTNSVNNVFTWVYCNIFSLHWIIWDGGRRKEKPMNLLRKLIEPSNIFFLKQAKSIIAYGSIAKNYFISLGINPEKVFIAQNTIDVDACLKEAERLKATPLVIEEVRRKLSLNEKKVILYVGALEKRKKVEDLITVFNGLKNETTDISLLIIGDGAYRQKLMDLAKIKDIKDCLFLGKILEGIECYFALSDVFVLPGRGGLSINQAMCFGKPIVVGEGDGTEVDLVKNGVNGFIVKEKAELNKGIKDILQDKNKAENMARESLKIIKKYNLNNMCQQFVEAIEFSNKRKIPNYEVRNKYNCAE